MSVENTCFKRPNLQKTGVIRVTLHMCNIKPEELKLSCTAQVLNITHIHTTIRSVAALKVRCCREEGS